MCSGEKKCLLLWDEDQHAVVSDGVDDGVGGAVRVALSVPLFEVKTLKQRCGQTLSPLSRLGKNTQRSEKVCLQHVGAT